MAAGRFSVEAIFKAVDRMSAPVAKMSSRIDRMTRGASRSLAQVDAAFGKVHSTIARSGVAMAGAGVAMGLAARSVIGAGADFEQAITNVGAVSLMTRDQVADLEKRALALGSSTKFSASEVAAGMELMGRAGFTNAQILQGIEGVLSAAAAEGAELAETAGHISNVLKGMGLETSEATRVADVLTLASARTNSSISSLGESMKNTAATARQFRIPLEDTVAAVALLQDVGLDASEAGSAVNTMLTRLATPTDKIRAKMRELGISFQDARGNMLPLREVLANFAVAAKKSGGNMKQVAFFAQLAEVRGAKAAANLKDLFLSGKFEQLATELEGAAGSAKKMADLRMDTLLGDWETFTGAVDGVKISLFSLEKGPLRGVVQGWTKWIEANQDLIVSEVQGFLMTLRKELPGIAAGAKNAGSAALEFFKTVRQNLPTIILWAERGGKLVLGFYALSAAVKVAQVALYGYRSALVVAKAAQWMFNKSLIATGVEAGVTGAALEGWRGKLNASQLGGAINGIKSQLGKAGLLGAALLVGVAIGSWLDETFGLSKKLEDFMAKFFELEDAISQGTKKRGIIPGAPMEHAPIDRPYEAPRAGLDPLPLGDDFMNRPRPAPQVVTQAEQVAGAMSSESKTTEEMEITIRDESGRAEVTRAPGKGSRSSLKMPESGRKR